MLYRQTVGVGGLERQLDGRGAGRQERARRPRIAQGPGREGLLQVQRHEGRPGPGRPGFLDGGLVLGQGEASPGAGSSAGDPAASAGNAHRS